jgi:hypothetical protein
MSGYELECLRLDIKENGLREPIITYQGKILDGGNRFNACHAAGVEPTFKEFDGNDIAAFVMSANFHRRHLPISQHAAIVSSVQDWVKAQKHGKVMSAPESTQADTTKSRAALSGASVSTQRRADAVAKADPELAKQVAHGEVGLQQAVEKVAPQLASKPKKQRASEDPTLDDQIHPDEEYDQKQILINTIDAQAEEIAALTDRVAAATMNEDQSKVVETLDSLRAEIKKLKADKESAVKLHLDCKRLNDQLRKQISRLEKQIKNLEGAK